MAIIPLLTQHFLNIFNKKYNKNIKIPKVIINYFNSYKWPGNIRELENTIQRLILTCSSDTVSIADLPKNIKQSELKESTGIKAGMSLQKAEKIFIKETLIENNLNISKTAKVLGVTRKTLHNKIEKYKELTKLLKNKKNNKKWSLKSAHY